jgi:hypothetical protein
LRQPDPRRGPLDAYLGMTVDVGVVAEGQRLKVASRA